MYEMKNAQKEAFASTILVGFCRR